MLGIGTISHGTLKVYDLACALLPYAEKYLNTWPHTGVLNDLRSIVECGPDVEQENDIEALHDAMDALQDVCLPYTYIGMHPDDGSDLGVWPDIDAVEMGIQDGDLIKVADLSELDSLNVEDGDLVVVVNDHGNMTLSRVRIEIETDEVWSVV